MKLLNGCTAEDGEFESILTDILLGLTDDDLKLLNLLNEARKRKDGLACKVVFKMSDGSDTGD